MLTSCRGAPRRPRPGRAPRARRARDGHTRHDARARCAARDTHTHPAARKCALPSCVGRGDTARYRKTTSTMAHGTLRSSSAVRRAAQPSAGTPEAPKVLLCPRSWSKRNRPREGFVQRPPKARPQSAGADLSECIVRCRPPPRLGACACWPAARLAFDERVQRVGILLVVARAARAAAAHGDPPGAGGATDGQATGC